MEWRRRGGLFSMAALPADTPDPPFDSPQAIAAFLSATANHVLKGNVTPAQAMAAIAAATAATRAFELNIAARVNEMEQVVLARARPVSGIVVVDDREAS